jgi:hypothetical protein
LRSSCSIRSRSRTSRRIACSTRSSPAATSAIEASTGIVVPSTRTMAAFTIDTSARSRSGSANSWSRSAVRSSTHAVKARPTSSLRGAAKSRSARPLASTMRPLSGSTSRIASLAPSKSARYRSLDARRSAPTRRAAPLNALATATSAGSMLPVTSCPSSPAASARLASPISAAPRTWLSDWSHARTIVTTTESPIRSEYAVEVACGEQPISTATTSAATGGTIAATRR